MQNDLKLENIMVSFEDPAVMGDFMNDQFDQPMEYKIDSTGRPVYQRHNDFGPLRQLRNIIPKIVDFGHCARLDSDDDWGIYPIQPDHYRAPEVVLGCGWRMNTDLWNLGVIVILHSIVIYCMANAVPAMGSDRRQGIIPPSL
ncbi:unnamed protein product [Aspergillus oryzae]|nr:unnamed protein product [Aspergillus oryzae]